MRIHTRLGLSVCLTVFSLVCIVLLLPRSRVGSQLQRIALASSIDNYWDWGTVEKGIDGGVRLVVFGDSWVDNSIENGKEGKGRSWTEVLCDEINCSSYLNFGASQPSNSYPTSPPTGAISSNHIYTSSAPKSGPDSAVVKMLPDLAAQVDEFLSLPLPESQPDETFFVVSFGIWDIEKLASLEYFTGQQAIAAIIPEIFAQLDKVYTHYAKGVKTPAKPKSSNDTEETKTRKSSFQVIIPKLFDPTLLPGWLSQRPAPLRPSSIAEQQKNGKYLTDLWNAILENKVGDWLQNNASAKVEPNVEGKQQSIPEKEINHIAKDIFYYDLPRYLLDIIVEHDLEAAGISDAEGLGNGESPFVQVYQPCVLDLGNGNKEGYRELDGQLVCKAPNEYLFWDGFNLGSIAKEGIGKEVGEMIVKGKTMKNIWKGEKGFWGAV